MLSEVGPQDAPLPFAFWSVAGGCVRCVYLFGDLHGGSVTARGETVKINRPPLGNLVWTTMNCYRGGRGHLCPLLGGAGLRVEKQKLNVPLNDAGICFVPSGKQPCTITINSLVVV